MRMLSIASSFSAAAVAAAMPPIVLDGQFDEWAPRPAALIDPADTPKGSLDLGMIKVADDPARLCFFVELGRTVNLQRLDGRLVLVLDADGDPASGDEQHGLAGADLLVTFTPPDPRNPAKPGFGVGVRRFEDGVWKEVGPYVQPVAFAPTAASRNTEICLDRDERTFAGSAVRFRFAAFDAGGKVVDESDVAAVPLTTRPARFEPAAREQDPLSRAPDTALRVVAWNVERAGLVTKPERFARVLRALKPDIVLFSELTDKESAEVVRSWLETHLAEGGGATAGRWNVSFGVGGGNLRTAVASRLPLSAPAEVERIVWSDSPGRRRDVRASSAVVEVDGRRLLALAVHLKCCGGLDTDEELTRLEEVQAIRSTLRLAALAGIAAAGERRIDGLIIGGDLNLVGAFEPLDLLVEGMDVDGTDLAVARALQLDARTAATWRDPTQPFTAGQLDFVVFSDSALAKRRAFVFETPDLPPAWLAAHGLEADDTTEASDHLPVVVDLGWTTEGR